MALKVCVVVVAVAVAVGVVVVLVLVVVVDLSALTRSPLRLPGSADIIN